MTKYFVGTSGWSYKHWIDVFYPPELPSNQWISHYAESFNSVELNMSFYRTPSQKAIEGWMAKTPDDFVFVMKASRFITHVKRLKNVDDSVFKLNNLIEQFQSKLRCILFQLPPGFSINEENMDRVNNFLNLLSEGYDYVFEFRDASWWDEKCYDLLRDRASFCSVNGLEMPGYLIITNKVGYFRFHGHHYDTEYSLDELNYYADRIKELAINNDLKRVYVFFNNDAYGFAVKNATQLMALLAK